MDKKTLDSILKNAYNLPLWRQVLTEVFGARNLNQKPQPILLPSNDLAKEAFELGFFNTTDDRIIGIYQIDLKDKVKIERNKVGLRELLRSVYKYDVDGALVVFVQKPARSKGENVDEDTLTNVRVSANGDKWRLSFVSEIRVLNDDGTIDTKATEPKRYTYLLGKDEKTKTPTDRLALLTNKKIALEDIRAAFSVEALNNEFYKQISEYFYQLVGATTTKGKKTEVRPKTMKLPGVAEDDRKTYQEFAVRLIGRTVFCWFLREKKSEQNKPLLPEKLLSSNAVGANRNYYHEILEPLFFQTLNTPMNERIEDLPKGCEIVPFLNGGLFEPQIEDFYNAESKTGSYQNYALKIPDSWFAEFFAKLEEYNFTIDENSPTEVEISVDPEMLGRIFENLLAEIDPDSGETARKATGSFYTPREIVNYMVDESLLIYLKSKLQTETFGFQAFGENQATFFGNEMRVQQKFEIPLSNNRWQTNLQKPARSKGESVGGEEHTYSVRVSANESANNALETELRKLFAYSDNENPFNETETEILIKAIHDCKILDPACGSGAFPIGVLQRLVHLLGKLDADNTKWKEWLKQKAFDETKLAFDEGDVGQRNERLRQISEAFEKDSSDFGRKLFLIENCIYGVDIQPIAAEISKLRCFLTLIVDDTIDEAKPNRGVNPLPNLEFKFVTADALLKLPASGLFQATTEKQMSELEQIRHEYINSYGERKEAAKRRFKQIQDEIFDSQIKNNRENPDKRAIALSTWNPFGHEKVDWFDSLWMFGVKGFDIVIGNPPYVQMQKDGGRLTKRYEKENYETLAKTGDVYCLFYEQGNNLLNKGGTLCFITSNKWMRADYGEKLRKYFLTEANPKKLIDFGGHLIFETATVDTNVLISEKNTYQKKIETCFVRKDFGYKNGESLSDYFIKNNVAVNDFDEQSWVILDKEKVITKRKVEAQGIPLKDWELQINYGIKTGLDEAFVIDGETKDRLISADAKNAEIIKPMLRGKDIKAWHPNFSDLWLIYIPWHFPLHEDNSVNGASEKAEKEFEKEFPAIYKHLLNHKIALSKRNQAETGIRYEWYALQRFGSSYWREFFKPKILYPNMTKYLPFIYDEIGYIPNAKCYSMTGENLKYLTAFLNSKLFKYCFIDNFPTLGEDRRELQKRCFENIPVKKISKEKQKPFENLVDYILFLKETDVAQVNEYVPNSHLVEQFEEVIDALVYELYFEEDFRTAKIEFLKYATRDFPPIENLARPDKIKTVHAAYQTLRQKDNEIRNNLKLMDIRLADLIMPIKTAR